MALDRRKCAEETFFPLREKDKIPQYGVADPMGLHTLLRQAAC